MRTKKALLNICISMMYQIVAIVCGLITPRLILSAFGSTYNGVVNSASQFLSMISLLTLGITGATRVALYKTLASNDKVGTSRIMRATNIYMRKVGFAIILYTCILSVLYPFFSHNNLSNIQNMCLVLIVGIGVFAEYFFGISCLVILQADQANYVLNFINILKTISNTIIVAILIHLGANIFVVKFGSAIAFFCFPLLLSIYVKYKYQLDKKCIPDYSAIKGRGAVAFHSIANLIHNNTDLVVLTVFTDAKLISVYTVYYLVIGKIKTLMQVFTSGMEAAFGNMWVKKEYKNLNENFSMYEYALYAFTVIIFSCVGLLILPFISLYTREVNDINYVRTGLAVLIIFAESVYCIREPYVTLVYATGSYSETKNGALVEAVINIVLSIVLVWRIGVEGVIIGTLVANLFRTIQFSVFVSKNILHRSFLVVLKRLIWSVTTVTMILLPSTFGIKFLGEVISWKDWIVRAIMCFCISCLITFLMSMLFYKNELFIMFRKIKSVKRK